MQTKRKISKGKAKDSTSSARKIIAVLFVLFAILYLVSPIDIIPDFIPVIGWMDDLVVLALAGAFALDTF